MNPALGYGMTFISALQELTGDTEQRGLVCSSIQISKGLPEELTLRIRERGRGNQGPYGIETKG